MLSAVEPTRIVGAAFGEQVRPHGLGGGLVVGLRAHAQHTLGKGDTQPRRVGKARRVTREHLPGVRNAARNVQPCSGDERCIEVLPGHRATCKGVVEWTVGRQKVYD